MAKKKKMTDDKKKEILQDLDGDDLPPPPYWIMTHLLPSAPPGPEVALMPDPGPGEVPAAATALPPSLRSLLSRRFGRLQSQQWRPLVNAPRIPPQLNLRDCIHLSCNPSR